MFVFLQEQARSLGIKPYEVTSLQSQMDTYHSAVNATPRVRFETDSAMSPIDFISCFSCHLHHKEKVEGGAEGGEKPGIELVVQLKQGLTEARKLKLGKELMCNVYSF